MAPSENPDVDAIVVGAGIGGIRALWELTQLGLKVRCIEAGTDVGGAWYWNKYPGARTDSEAWAYIMNFAPEVQSQWDYKERYPSQKEVQDYLKRVVDHHHLRQYIQFSTRAVSSHYDDEKSMWIITTANGVSMTCRYFLPATGPLSIGKDPDFAGLKSFKGQWYQSCKWPVGDMDFTGKRVAIVGTGATGVQIIPKLAPTVSQLTVYQRTPNYVLPARNYLIDEHIKSDIKTKYDKTWDDATRHPYGLAMYPTGNTITNTNTAEAIQKILDCGWERGGFHFMFETFDDLFTNQESNDIASEYLRQKIRAVVTDPETAEALCPRYPFLSKRPPCGHFYYETFNRPNVKLIDVKNDQIELFENGIRTTSGKEDEFDVIIFAIGFNAGTGALEEIDIKGSQGQSLHDVWKKKLETFAGVLIPGFPNLFSICGPHVPFGNMPVVVDIQAKWIGKTLKYMRENELDTIDVTDEAAQSWGSHLADCFKATILAESARQTRAWFVGAGNDNVEDANRVLFYFGGVPTWASWLEKETDSSWKNMDFKKPAIASQAVH